MEKFTKDKNLTEKFLSGEFSFSEYSRQWSEDNYDEENETIDNAEENQDVENEGETSVSEKRAKRMRSRTCLPPALMGLMGEANLKYARGEHEMAEQMCYEIIRQVPTAFEPFQTLAQIYENDTEKSLQFNIIAAHLNHTDAEQWVRLGSIAKEKADLTQAVYCYTRAVRANLRHLPYHLARLELIKEMEEKKINIPGHLTYKMCLFRSLNCYSDNEGATVLKIAKSLAQEFHKENDISKACKSMDYVYNRFSNLFTFEDFNLYLELLIALKRYDTCIHIFVTHCGIEIEAEVQLVLNENNVKEETTNIINCSIPASLPIDLHTKLIICLIHMKVFHLVDIFIDGILENENVENNGDIFLDIEEALISEECYERALKILKVLVSSSRFSLPAVWLKYAECLAALNLKNEAIGAYKTVVQLAPQHIDARMKLSLLLKEDNRVDEALIALEQNEKTDVLDVGLLYERCKILKSKQNLSEYFKVGSMMLSRHFFKARNREELQIMKQKEPIENIKALRKCHREPIEDEDALVFDDNCEELTVQTEWTLLNDLLKIAYDSKNYKELERLIFSALCSKRFNEYKNTLEFYAILSCFYNKDYYYAFNYIRIFCTRMPNVKGVWNMFNLLLQKTCETRYNKFIGRLLQRTEDNSHLKLLYANMCLCAASYKYALKEYIHFYKIEPTPLTALLCGVTMLNIATQRFSTNKHTLVTTCFAFLSHYEKLRGTDCPQEVYYNIGRAYHQIGLFHLAVQYYKKALQFTVDFDYDNIDTLDLRREIAFNLHLIYKNDVPELAQMYLEKYVVI